MTSTMRPAVTEFAPFYAGYVASVPDGDIISVLRATGEDLSSTLATIPESKAAHRYAEGKWTVRTVLGHMIDAERIFTYRALRLARGDSTPLPSFEENEFAKTAGSDARTIADLAAEMTVVRDASVRLFASLPDDAWARRGIVSGREATVRALAYITTGHAQHHLGVLRERYGV
jgi:hypothetical protein